ncbi:uncharacterized protein [Amphiura filiformis]|uniref:uncharacterized protein isoform X2 n=1 Tax=Amphiura filiformis TaxID=82378 RepID=UPI003B20BA47
MVRFASILILAAFTSASAHVEFKQLSRKEISKTSHWIPQSDSFKMKNCGPPFSISVMPWPVDFKHGFQLEVNFKAAHTLIDGNLEVHYNQWPYDIELNFCDYALHKGVKLCPIKKGETYSLNLSDSGKNERYKGHYKGNVTITNSNDETMLCFSLDATL